MCICGSEPAVAYLSLGPLIVEQSDCRASFVVCKQAPEVKCHIFTIPDASAKINQGLVLIDWLDFWDD